MAVGFSVCGALRGLCGLCCRAFPDGLPPSSLLWEQRAFHDFLPICFESARRATAPPFGRASSAHQHSLLYTLTYVCVYIYKHIYIYIYISISI